MSEQIEKLVFPSVCAKRLGVTVATVSAVKRVMGIERKKVFPSEVCGYLKTHPEFTVTQIYKKKVVQIAS